MHRQTNLLAVRSRIRNMSNELLNTTGKRIRALRNDKGLTQEGLGLLVGAGKIHINRVESGERKASRELLQAIARELNTTVSFLLLEVDVSTPPNDPDPIYFSAEADEIARMVDDMTEPQRALVLNIVRMIAAHAVQLKAQDPAVGIAGANLVVRRVYERVSEPGIR